MHKIAKPFFFLCALDDPFFGPDVIPIGQCNQNVLIGTTRFGSHVSYVEGKWIPTNTWYPKPVFTFLQFFNSLKL